MQMMSTFPIEGIDANRAWIAILRPLFLLIIRRGLSPLIARNALMLLRFSELSELVMNRKYRSIRDTTTTMKSSRSQIFRVYAGTPWYWFQKNPKAMIFKAASIQNKTVKITSNTSRVLENVVLGSSRGVWMHSIIQLKKMIMMMKNSNARESAFSFDTSSNKTLPLLILIELSL